MTPSKSFRLPINLPHVVHQGSTSDIFLNSSRKNEHTAYNTDNSSPLAKGSTAAVKQIYNTTSSFRKQRSFVDEANTSFLYEGQFLKRPSHDESTDNDAASASASASTHLTYDKEYIEQRDKRPFDPYDILEYTQVEIKKGSEALHSSDYLPHASYRELVRKESGKGGYDNRTFDPITSEKIIGKILPKQTQPSSDYNATPYNGGNSFTSSPNNQKTTTTTSTNSVSNVKG